MTIRTVMLGLALAATFAMAGCQSTQSIDAAIQKNLPQICSAAETAHIAFTAVAATGRISERTVQREVLAWNALVPLCTDPASATTADVLVAAATAYATITTALRAAEQET